MPQVRVQVQEQVLLVQELVLRVWELVQGQELVLRVWELVRVQELVQVLVLQVREQVQGLLPRA